MVTISDELSSKIGLSVKAADIKIAMVSGKSEEMEELPEYLRRAEVFSQPVAGFFEDDTDSTDFVEAVYKRTSNIMYDLVNEYGKTYLRATCTYLKVR